MKVLLIEGRVSEPVGGAEISSWLQGKLLRNEGIEVSFATYVSRNLPAFEVVDGIKFYRVLPMRLIPGLPIGSELLGLTLKDAHRIINKLVAKEKYDVIHIQDSLIQVSRVKDAAKVPVITTVRDYWPLCPFGTLWDGENICLDGCYVDKLTKCVAKQSRQFSHSTLAYYFGWALENAIFLLPRVYVLYRKFKEAENLLATRVDGIVAISRFVKEVLTRRLKIDGDAIDIVYNPLPEELLDGNYDECYAKPEGGAEKCIVFGFMGGAEYLKGVKNLLCAFKRLLARNVKARLVIAGGGGRWGGDKYIRRYEESFNEISYLGRLSYSEALRVMRKIDVLVVPSLWPEPFGRVALEGMACGKPVIINPVGGLPEIVEDGVTGFYANCYNCDAFAEKLIEVASMPRQRLIEMGIKARKNVLRKFDNKREIKKLIDIYERVC